MRSSTCLIAFALAATAWARPQYALIVANNQSNDPKVASLRFADDDGARYYEWFAPQTREAVLLTVLDADTQRLHPGLAAKTRPPTRRELDAALADLNALMKKDRAAGEEPVLYFIFTGHGQRSEAGEGTISLLGEPFSRSDLFDKVLAPSEASYVHLIIDACDSYFFVNARGGLPVAKSEAAAVEGYLGERTLAKFPNVGVVLSTASEMESHEWSAIGAGVFSHQVRSALSGAADANGDGRVDYSELKAFIAAANLRVEDPRARIQLFAQPPARDRSAPLADLTGASQLTYLMLPAELSGRLHVEDERGVRLVDLHKERERSQALALPVGHTYFLRSTTREAKFEASSPGQVVDAGQLAFADLQVASRGAVAETFRDHLFETPFGPKFYGGFVSSSGDVPAEPLAADLTP